MKISLTPSSEQDVPQHCPTILPCLEELGNAHETLTLGRVKPFSIKIGSKALTARSNQASRVRGISESISNNKFQEKTNQIYSNIPVIQQNTFTTWPTESFKVKKTKSKSQEG